MPQISRHGPITRVLLTRIIFGRPIYSASCFLVDGLLIDSGPPCTARELVAWCREQAVEQAIITHHHEDHSGGVHPLQQALELPIAAAPATADVLARFPRIQLYRRVVWGAPPDVQVDRLAAEVATKTYRFQVIPTPGHCSDHVCLFEPAEGWLFSGDLFIHERARYLRVDEDIWLLIASLRHALALQPKLILCAHAGVIEDACGALRRKLAFWEELAEQASALRQQGLSVNAVALRALGHEGWMSRISRGHISKRNLIRSLLDSPREDSLPG